MNYKRVYDLWNGYINRLRKLQDQNIPISYPNYQSFALYLHHKGTKKDRKNSLVYYETIMNMLSKQ